MINRATPEVGYQPPENTIALGFHAYTENDGLVFLSGVAPFHGPEATIVGEGDLKAQTSYVLEIIEKLLIEAGSSPSHILDWIVYLKDFDGTGEVASKFIEIAPQLTAFTGGEYPCATAVGVPCLFTKEQYIEIQVTARKAA
ncbi:RidA family protein [Phaeobacter sp. PT47_59]|uniref:RidA family protein n=1 Tax=Phaeobacter sp. PT47_59 TaxID=3029979 RepID=UPI0023806F00|nr:RidA family protein [Phaeobacter sp. PT47_59]MDE4175414.1 RidA family protein [Phaeobacter sp. PT47_59]